ncbi:MAG: hypothetical protein GC161_01570 [Planctomycetaceae bacterium]|nr:hypothetical protein [Planctomycetaceae bacterium]
MVRSAVCLAVLCLTAPVWARGDASVAAAVGAAQNRGAGTGARLVQPHLDPVAQCLHLLRATRAADAPPRDVTVAQLRRLFPIALPAALDWVAAGRLPGTTNDDGEQALSESQIEYLLEGIAPLGRHALVAAANEWLAGRNDIRARRAVLVLSGAAADSRDLAWLVQLAAPLPDTQLDPSLERAFEQSLCAMFRRDLRALPAVIATRHLIPDSLQPAYTRALGGSRDERAVLGLRHVWDRGTAAEALVLAQIRLLPTPRDGGDVEELASRLRRALDRVDPGSSARLQALVFALGHLEDWHSAALLVPLLEQRDRGVRDAAVWSLRRISGANFAADPAHWRDWCQQELAWYEGRAENLVQQLASGEAKRASLALRELVGHRMFRHPLVAMLDVLLVSEDKKARAAACQTLAQLGSQRAQRALLERLEDRDGTVRDAAWQALVTLAGRDLPRKRLECLAELFPAEPVF